MTSLRAPGVQDGRSGKAGIGKVAGDDLAGVDLFRFFQDCLSICTGLPCVCVSPSLGFGLAADVGTNPW